MMKRNEGYTLPFVLVVMVVLCTVAISITSVTLRNLVNQQKFMDRMTDRYAAQGQIEMIVAQLEHNAVNEKIKLHELCDGMNMAVNMDEDTGTIFESMTLTVCHETAEVTAVLELTGTNLSISVKSCAV